MHRLKGRKNVNRNNIFSLNKDGARNHEKLWWNVMGHGCLSNFVYQKKLPLVIAR